MGFRKWVWAIGLFGSSLSMSWAAAPGDSDGITLESTRVIYPASAKNGITFTVTNHTQYVYLLQSRVLQWAIETPAEAPVMVEDEPIADVNITAQTEAADNVVSPSFIVLPPLTRFAPNEAMTLRIRLTKNDFPQDQESVFLLSLKAIPSQANPSSKQDETGALMVLALQNNLKLFYRPEGLPLMSADARAEALQFSRHGAQLTINNPTPYYVTLGQVKIGNSQLDVGAKRMLAPFTSATYPDARQGATTVSWQLIDDEGQQTPLLTQALP